MVFHKVLWWCPQVESNFKEYERKIQITIVKVMKFTSKTRLNHLLLRINFDDKYWRSQLDYSIFEYSTQQQRSSWKEIQFKQCFATTFRPLTKKIMVLVYRSIFLVHFTMLAPIPFEGDGLDVNFIKNKYENHFSRRSSLDNHIINPSQISSLWIILPWPKWASKK